MSDESIEDAELLRRAAAGSREALAQIARRYVGFVYAAALRQVRDPHLAEDVAQAVFVILARKVRQLDAARTLLHGWLFTTTRYAAANAMKMQRRRAHHERVAAAVRGAHHPHARDADAPDAMTPLLDEALADLRDADRSAVLLSYFGGKTFREVGAAIGLSEEAARKRVERAVARMRQFFAKRGVAVSAGAVVATLSDSARAASPPPALLEAITTYLTGPTVTGAASIGALAKGVFHMMTWSQVKVAGAVAAIVLTTLVGAVAATLNHGRAPKDEKPSPPPAEAVVELDNDAKVELLGVSRKPSAGQAWWHADGSPANAPYAGSDASQGTIGDDPDDAREVVLRVTGPHIDELGVRIELPDGHGWTTGELDDLDGARTIAFTAGRKHVADLRITLATGPWETMLTQEPVGFRSDRRIVFGPAVDEGGSCIVTTSDDLTDHQVRVIAIGVDGQTHEASAYMMGIAKQFRQMTTRFNLPKDEIEHFEFQARPFDQFVEFKNVALAPGKNAGFSSAGGKVELKRDDR